MNNFLLFIILMFNLNLTIAQHTIHFMITDESGGALIGVSIKLTGTLKGTITDSTGEASLDNLPKGKVEIEISYLGFEAQKLSLNFPEDNGKIFKIKLKEKEEILEEIIISTIRSSRTIEDIPTRIEVITSEELGEKAAMNSSNIGMLLSETTGVRVQQTSLSSGNLSIRIQGLDGRYTQILKDGFPLYGGFAGGLSIMQIPPLDLKQVELIKGSNSTLYGGGAIAGLVNLITIQPEEKPELSVMVDQTSAMGTTGNLFYAQKYGKTGLTLYGSADNQRAYDPDNDGFSNIPKSKTFNLNPRIFIFFNPDTELSLGINATVDSRKGGDMEVIKGNRDENHVFSEKNTSNRFATLLDFHKATENYILSLKNSINYFERNLTIPDYVFSGNQLSSFSEILMDLQKNKKSDWQFGVNYYTENFNEKILDSLPGRDYNYHTVGGFIQNMTTVSKFLTIESGLRTDYNVDYGAFFLPRVSVLLKPATNLTSRLGGAFGYKLPTIFTEDAEKLYFRGIAPLDILGMEPEKSVGGNFDINYRMAFLKKFTFSLNQLFFITLLENSLVLRENSMQGGYFYENADGNVISSGLETNAKFTYENFILYVNYAYVNTVLKYDNIKNQKPLTPKHNAGFVLFYEVEEKWSAGYELYYNGSQFDGLYDKKPDYWIMGIMLMRKFRNLSIYVNFENFTSTMQSDFEPLVWPPYDNPRFPDIWSPVDGFVFNAGFRYNIL